MSEPTARELLGQFRYYNEKTGEPFGRELTHEANAALASRVEKVLALKQDKHGLLGYDACLREVFRILNGEQP